MWLAVGAVVVLGLVWYFGAQGQKPAPPLATPPAATAVASATPAAPTGPVSLEPAQSAATGGFVVPAVEEGFDEPKCGDFTCDANERCDTCAQDCGCAGGEYCNRLNGVCYELD